VIIRDFYYGATQIVAVYKGRELIYSRSANLRAFTSAAMVTSGDMKSLMVCPLSASGDLTAKTIASMEALQVSAMESDIPMEIVSHADLYVYLVANCASDEDVAIDLEMDAHAPMAAVCGIDEKLLTLQDEAEANAPTSVPVRGVEGVTTASSGEMNTPQSAVIPGASVNVFDFAGEGTQSVASAVPVGAGERIGIEHEATLTILELVKVVDGALYIPFAYEATQNGDVLEVS
jgi:hypothetical protein